MAAAPGMLPGSLADWLRSQDLRDPLRTPTAAPQTGAASRSPASGILCRGQPSQSPGLCGHGLPQNIYAGTE
jgi:hypothetical protein